MRVRVAVCHPIRYRHTERNAGDQEAIAARQYPTLPYPRVGDALHLLDGPDCNLQVGAKFWVRRVHEPR